MDQYISACEARKVIENHIFPTGKITVSLLAAQGFYTAEPIWATLDVPSFDNSAMDGYGFLFEDLTHFTKLKVTQVIPAGISGKILYWVGEKRCEFLRGQKFRKV